jgi:hypothetical protein
MWWFKRRPEKPLREQLIEARNSLRREIEIPDAGPAPGPASFGSRRYDQERANVLRGTLAEIEQQLVKVESKDA